jgi:hypothetical protein
MKAYFSYTNAARPGKRGSGRQVTFYDDGYNPVNSVHARKLVSRIRSSRSSGHSAPRSTRRWSHLNQQKVPHASSTGASDFGGTTGSP